MNAAGDALSPEAARELDDAHNAIGVAIDKLSSAEPHLPAYALEALVFARCEARVLQRRLTNLRRVVGTVKGGES